MHFNPLNNFKGAIQLIYDTLEGRKKEFHVNFLHESKHLHTTKNFCIFAKYILSDLKQVNFASKNFMKLGPIQCFYLEAKLMIYKSSKMLL